MLLAGLQSALEQGTEVAQFLVNLDEVGGHFGPEVAEAGHRVRSEVVDTSVDIVEAPVDLLEAFVNLLETFVSLPKAL